MAVAATSAGWNSPPVAIIPATPSPAPPRAIAGQTRASHRCSTAALAGLTATGGLALRRSRTGAPLALPSTRSGSAARAVPPGTSSLRSELAASLRSELAARGAALLPALATESTTLCAAPATRSTGGSETCGAGAAAPARDEGGEGSWLGALLGNLGTAWGGGPGVAGGEGGVAGGLVPGTGGTAFAVSWTDFTVAPTVSTVFSTNPADAVETETAPPRTAQMAKTATRHQNRPTALAVLRCLLPITGTA